MENETRKKLMFSISLVLLAVIIALVGFKVMILDDNGISMNGAKSVRKIGVEEERKIFGLEEEKVEEGKIPTDTPVEPITVTKTIACGNNTNIYEGQVQTYYITVKNNTDAEISNIKVVDEIPAQLTYTEEITGEGYESKYEEKPNIKQFKNTIERIGAKEQVELRYFARVNMKTKDAAEESDAKIGTKATATIKGDSTIYESNLVENTIKESKLQIEVITTHERVEYFRPNDNIVLFAKIKNISEEDLNNIAVSCKLPEQEDYIISEYLIKNEETSLFNETFGKDKKQGEYSEEDREAKWKIDNLKAGEECAVKLMVSLQDKTTDENVVRVKNLFTATVGEEEFHSNLFEIDQLNKTKLNVKLSVSPENIAFYEGDEFEYIATVEVPETSSEKVELKTKLPDGLIGKEIAYSESGREESTMNFNEEAVIKLNLDESKTQTVRLKVEADKLEEGIDEKEIKNQIVLSGADVIAELSNEVTVTVKKKQEPVDNNDNNNNSDNNENNNNDNTQTENNNTENNNTENNNNENNNNENNNIEDNNIEDNNNDNNNIEDNNNDNKNKENNNNNEGNKNIDAIKEDDDEEDNISSKFDSNEKFDLKINKYVNKVTVKDTEGTYQYEFGNANLAKIELDRKTLNSTSIVVEYKIVVTNEGTAPGYIKNIVDILPENLEFKSELNTDWYNNNGQLENISLANKMIRTIRTKRAKISVNKEYNRK